MRFQRESLRNTLQPGTAFTGMEAELIGNTWKELGARSWELGARKERAARHSRSKCNDIPKNFFFFFLPPVLLQQLPDEALGQLAGVAEELLVKVIVHGRDVSQRLLLGIAEERRRSAQTEKRPRNILTSDNVCQRSKIPLGKFKKNKKKWDDLQDVGDDPDAPVEKKDHTVNPEFRCRGSRVGGRSRLSPHVCLQAQQLIVDYLRS